MEALKALFRSAAFYTALISFAGVCVMRYTQVPPEIWQSFVGLASAIVLALIGKEVGVDVGIGFSRGFLEYEEAKREAAEVEEAFKLAESQGVG